MLKEIYAPSCEGVPLWEINIPASARIYKHPHGLWLHDEIVEWLCEHVGPQSSDYNHMFLRDWQAMWCVNAGTTYAFFQFRTKDHAMLFKLTWG